MFEKAIAEEEHAGCEAAFFQEFELQAEVGGQGGLAAFHSLSGTFIAALGNEIRYFAMIYLL